MTGIVVLTIVSWFAYIAWVAVDAGKRRISPVCWPLATLLSSPLGLVAYGVVRDMVGKKAESQRK